MVRNKLRAWRGKHGLLIGFHEDAACSSVVSMICESSEQSTPLTPSDRGLFGRTPLGAWLLGAVPESFCSEKTDSLRAPTNKASLKFRVVFCCLASGGHYLYRVVYSWRDTRWAGYSPETA